MTISEYYQNYKHNKNYPIKLCTGNDTTISDFYNNCIKINCLKYKNVIEWHKMLLEYINRSDAIYWVRYYESGNKSSGRWNNRRACLTEFSDGFKYVFVSNFDAHEILNMVRLGVKADVNEFAKLMNSYSFPMHYGSRKSCEESDINAYPNIGTPRGGILTFKHWYLAHIYDIKSKYLRFDGSYKKVEIRGDEGFRIYPRGLLTDWKFDPFINHKIRRLNYSLIDEEKSLVKAHFLRFIDPLNYYVTPSPKYEKNSVSPRIGEYSVLNYFMNNKYEKLYGTKFMDEFKKMALIKKEFKNATGNQIINITYGIQPTPKVKKVVTKSLVKSTKKVSVLESYSNLKVGQFAKNTFVRLFSSNKINEATIRCLLDKIYCHKWFGISYSVIVENVPGTYDSKRYYKGLIILKKYLLCSQWYEKNRIKIINWLEKQKLIK